MPPCLGNNRNTTKHQRKTSFHRLSTIKQSVPCRKNKTYWNRHPSKESIMAASSYYNKQSHMLDDDDQQQHLLSPNMSTSGFSSPGLSPGHPSPLKPLHLLSAQELPENQHSSHDLEDLEQLKAASHSDAVRPSFSLKHFIP
jgi:hypothetical protein